MSTLPTIIGIDIAASSLICLFSVHHTPHIGYITEHEWYEQRDVEHGAQRELATATVGYCQRALQIGI